MNINAIIFGATGMVGEGVLHVALHHANVESVLVIGRRSCNVKHPKLKELLHDNFFDFTSIEEHLKGYNACFFCLGVSSIGKDEQEYTRITYTLTMQAARTLSQLNSGMTFSYVSGAGTNETGRAMWARVKGKTESDLMKLPFKAVYAFRPGFIKPIKGLKHAYTVSKWAGTVYPVWKFLLPKYVCTLEDLGRAMVLTATNGYPKQILENRDISSIGETDTE